MQRNLRNMIHRMEMTEQDVRTLRGALVRLIDGPRKMVQTRKRIKAKPETAAQPADDERGLPSE